jgi:hypothetical protein
MLAETAISGRSFYMYPGSSPLRTATDDELRHVIAKAHSLQLKVRPTPHSKQPASSFHSCLFNCSFLAVQLRLLHHVCSVLPACATTGAAGSHR